MIWICVEYSGAERVYHIFKRAMLYVVRSKLHVHGTTLCGVEFSDDRSGSRTDTVFSLIIGVEDDDGLTAPMDYCLECHALRLPRRLVN